MKSLLPLLFLFFAFTACEKTDDVQPKETGIVGQWQLVEVLADPGDGSGTFQSVSSDKVLTFAADGTFTANGAVCEFTVEAGGDITGTYDAEAATLEPGGCRSMRPEITEIPYELAGEELILNYFCIEPCRHKFRRVQ